MIRILHVAGARPNFMKIAPLMEAFREYRGVKQVLVHTGQHYDDTLSRVFFDELDIPRPELNLEVGSASQAVQTARIMLAFEPVCVELRPDLVTVVGDVNSTVACALVAAKLGVKVAHIEAGLRSFDWTMPEELNRVLTDRLSHFLFTTERSANENLRREGIASDRIHFVGNVMIDTLLRHRDRARLLGASTRFGVTSRKYALVTLHRPSNVDDPNALRIILEGLARLADRAPVLLPLHPRTRQRIEEFALKATLGNVVALEPLGYLEFLGLMDAAGVVLTDSGGIQEETTVLGVPCLTLRANTERPVTIEHGTNRLVALDGDAIASAGAAALDAWTDGGSPARKVPELWDGRAADRIAKIVVERLSPA